MWGKREDRPSGQKSNQFSDFVGPIVGSGEF